MAKIKMSISPQLISITKHGQLSFMYVNNALYYMDEQPEIFLLLTSPWIWLLNFRIHWHSAAVLQYSTNDFQSDVQVTMHHEKFL